MDKRAEKARKEQLLKSARETQEERYKRVTSGVNNRPSVIPDKRRNKPKHKERNDEYEH